MKVMMKKTYVAYFILGFISVTFLKLPILAVALGALAIALIDFFNSQRADADVTRKPVQPEDAEDGI
jgi:PTS system N-acetylgalactosamine-specific IIC component